VVRLKHRARPAREAKPVQIDEDYQREVDASTEKLQRRYEAAERRAAKAAAQLAEAERKRANAAELTRLRAEWEAREAELAELARLMTNPPGGGVIHRGTKGWRKVPRG
jgi:hypothetical protein